MGSLANQYISQSFTSLIHLGSDTTISSSYTDLQDGLGNTLNISVNAQGDISASGNIYAANLGSITFDTGSLLTTASANLNTITFTKGNGSTFNVTVNTGSAGGSTDISSLNAFTASIAGTNAFTASIKNTNAFTASLAGTNAFTQSANQRLNSIESQSGSWVTSAITASSLVTASVNVNVITFTKGNGSTFDLTVSASGSVTPGTISGSAQIAALGFISSSVTSSMAVSSSLYAETSSLARNVIVSAINANQSTLPIGTVVRISGANGDNPQFNTASYIDETQSSNTLGVLGNIAVSGQYADIVVIGRVVGVNTAGMAAGDLLYLSSSGQFTNVAPQAPLNIVTLGEVLRVQQNNGSMFVNVSNGWELNELHNVRIVSAQQGDVLVYEASSSLWKNQPSSSFASSTVFNSYTSSTNSRLNSIEAATSSFVTSAITASSLVTASFSGNTLTFTKGNGTSFGLQIPDVSGSTINTGSFAITGSNNFVGTENINGQLNVTGSSSFTGSMNFLSGSASGSVVTNVGDTFTGTAAVTKIISLSSAEYSALTPKDPNTLYIIV